jgi:putative transposase
MNRRFPRRPPRLPTVFQNADPFYFVTFNTHERRPLLADEALHEAWLAFARRAPDHGVWVGRYVVMPDHIHLFVWLATDTELAAWVQASKAVLGKELLRHGHQKPHWQQGFFDHLLRSGESYEQKWEYVRQNPVRKGLCSQPEDWPYQGEVTPLEWL